MVPLLRGRRRNNASAPSPPTFYYRRGILVSSSSYSYYRLSLSAALFSGAATFLLGGQSLSLGLALSLLSLRAQLGKLPSLTIAQFCARLCLPYAFPFSLQERFHTIQGFLPDFAGEPSAAP